MNESCTEDTRKTFERVACLVCTTDTIRLRDRNSYLRCMWLLTQHACCSVTQRLQLGVRLACPRHSTPVAVWHSVRLACPSCRLGSRCVTLHQLQELSGSNPSNWACCRRHSACNWAQLQALSGSNPSIARVIFGAYETRSFFFYILSADPLGFKCTPPSFEILCMYIWCMYVYIHIIWSSFLMFKRSWKKETYIFYKYAYVCVCVCVCV